MLKCTECKTKYVYRLYILSGGVEACDRCYRKPFRTDDGNIHETVTLLKGQPGETKTTRAELAEIKRNVCIPTGDGHWKSGRRMENGRIAERPLKS